MTSDTEAASGERAGTVPGHVLPGCTRWSQDEHPFTLLGHCGRWVGTLGGSHSPSGLGGRSEQDTRPFVCYLQMLSWTPRTLVGVHFSTLRALSQRPQPFPVLAPFFGWAPMASNSTFIPRLSLPGSVPQAVLWGPCPVPDPPALLSSCF